MFTDPVHTCIVTSTTYDGGALPPCPGCMANSRIVGPIVRTMREVHLLSCGCTRCCPWGPAAQLTGGSLAPVSMQVPLADGEAPPEGWKFPGLGP